MRMAAAVEAEMVDLSGVVDVSSSSSEGASWMTADDGYY